MPLTIIAFPAVALSSPDASTDDIRALQARLVERGCGPVGQDAVFDEATVLAVKRFQVRFDYSAF